MKIFTLVPTSYNNAELEKLRLDRLFRTVKKAIDNKPEGVEVEVKICGLYGRGDTMSKYLKSTYGIITVDKGTNYADNRRHLLMKSIKGKIKEGDRFVFLDSDDMVSPDFFSKVNTEFDGILRTHRSSVVASQDGTLAVKIPRGDYASNFIESCVDEFGRSGDKPHIIQDILQGHSGGQIWANFFPASMLNDVYNYLQYISMWEDVRFWVELPEYKIKEVSGTYYWVRNNSESMCNNVNVIKRDYKFLVNLQAIIWTLQEMNLNPEDFALVRAAKSYLDRTVLTGEKDYPISPADRRIAWIDKEIHAIPDTEMYLESAGMSDWSFCRDENELIYLMDFLNCIVL